MNGGYGRSDGGVTGSGSPADEQLFRPTELSLPSSASLPSLLPGVSFPFAPSLDSFRIAPPFAQFHEHLYTPFAPFLPTSLLEKRSWSTPQPPRPSEPSPWLNSPFYRGSLVRLPGGVLKRVEELSGEDLSHAAERCHDGLCLEHCAVLRIDEAGLRAIIGFAIGQQRFQVSVDAEMEHPFFVLGQGWSSVSPERSYQRFRLNCARLKPGDVCLALTTKRRSSNEEEVHNPSKKPRLDSVDRGHLPTS